MELLLKNGASYGTYSHGPFLAKEWPSAHKIPTLIQLSIWPVYLLGYVCKLDKEESLESVRRKFRTNILFLRYSAGWSLGIHRDHYHFCELGNYPEEGISWLKGEVPSSGAISVTTEIG